MQRLFAEGLDALTLAKVWQSTTAGASRVARLQHKRLTDHGLEFAAITKIL
jgi:hypothetical protein